jgi:cell division protein FtsN
MPSPAAPEKQTPVAPVKQPPASAEKPKPAPAAKPSAAPPASRSAESARPAPARDSEEPMSRATVSPPAAPAGAPGPAGSQPLRSARPIRAPGERRGLGSIILVVLGAVVVAFALGVGLARVWTARRAAPPIDQAMLGEEAETPADAQGGGEEPSPGLATLPGDLSLAPTESTAAETSGAGDGAVEEPHVALSGEPAGTQPGETGVATTGAASGTGGAPTESRTDEPAATAAPPPSAPSENRAAPQPPPAETRAPETPPAESRTPASPPAVSPGPSAEGGPFGVQVAAYQDRAEAVADSIRQAARGPAVTIVAKLIPEKGGTWYRVIVGRFSDRTDAALLAERYKQESGLTYIPVVKLPAR